MPSSACKTSALRSEEHTSELQSPCKLVCRLLLEKKSRHLPKHLAGAPHSVFPRFPSLQPGQGRKVPQGEGGAGEPGERRRPEVRLRYFFLEKRRPPRSTLFPNTTLFR